MAARVVRLELGPVVVAPLIKNQERVAHGGHRSEQCAATQGVLGGRRSRHAPTKKSAGGHRAFGAVRATGGLWRSLVLFGHPPE
jgi:hypothetical protein